MVDLILSAPHVHEFYVLAPAAQWLEIKCLYNVLVYVVINIHNSDNRTASKAAEIFFR